MDDQYIVLAIGLPASGKSSFLTDETKVHSLLHSYVFPTHTVKLSLPIRVSFDALRGQILNTNYYQPTDPLVTWVGETMANYLLAQGQSILLDATSVTAKLRSKWVAKAKSLDIPIYAINFNTSKEICLKRNKGRVRVTGISWCVPDDVIERMAADFESPSLAEGFNKLINIGADGDLISVTGGVGNE